MNRVHRIVFNRTLGVMQVASELASSHGGSTDVCAPAPTSSATSGRARWLVCGLALAGSAAFVGAAWADTVTGTAGSNGNSAFFVGKNGGDGAAAVSLTGGTPGNTHIGNHDTRTGGAGGSGGAGAVLGGNGGKGGAGLSSEVAGNAIDNRGAITGGRGGNGGNSFAVGGAGGRGGAGVALSAAGTLDNSGTIVGGAGGDNGDAFVYSPEAGVGGVGVTASGDAHVTNSGSIAGGLGNDGTQADAVRFSGGDNVLELNKGSTITGNVVATSHGNDTLALGGSKAASFDVSAIGDAAQYRNFADFEKIGSSTWTLTGETSALTPWSVFDGTLSISSDANLGDAAGGLTLDGGALRTTADISSARNVTLGAGNGEIRTNSGTQLSLTGEVSGAGGLTKSGSGELKLGSSNSYQGGTTIESGTVVGSVGSFGSGAIADHAALVIDQASDATLRNDLSGEGSLTKTGAGALTLAGDTHLSGGASVTDGSLQLGSRWNTSGSIAGAQGEDGSPGLFTGSDGKAGGTGVTLSDSATGATNYGTFAGGRGGDGGSALGLAGDGARGGDGLQSSVAGATVRNDGTIAGGRGGNGGDSLTVGGAGGRGGDGVVMSAPGTLDNSGTIVGGAGGDNGDAFIYSPEAGAGGVGVKATGDTHVINSGSIAGGLGNDGKQADAIRFSGGDNVLELQRGSTITGNVVATAEGNDTLALGGRRDASFDVSAIGDTAQYRNFEDFEKTGSSTWTLTGETSALTPWSVLDGTLSISSDASLGDVAGDLTLDGGTLRTTAGITSARNVTLGANNGEIRTDGGTQLSLTGEVSGEGGLIKSGSGELTLGSSNSYQGGTAIESGTVVGSVGSFGSGAIADHAALVIDQASDATLRNDLSGEGSLTKTGAGALTLAGDTHLSGGASVTDGSLQLGSRWNTSGSIAGAQGEDGSPGLFTGSDGKAGGAGVTLSDSATGATNYGTFAGGRGGDGGSALGLAGDGGRGGDGLDSSVAGAVVGNAGTIVGGQGGAGGSAAGRGAGGAGGTGVALGASGTVNNEGSISGGRGGDRGAIGLGHPADAAGGVGITTTGDAYVVNSGSIAGGLSGDGKQADAIQFSGGDNVLELHRGSTITGNVVATEGGNDTLALGGRRDASFDVSAIGDAAQYRNFEDFEKTGSSTWTLTGETSALTPWSVLDGTLSISSDASLGDVAGDLTLDGGTLRTTAGITSARNVTLGANNGEIRTDGGTQLSLTGEVSGEGGLIKSGSGELTLGSSNSYQGGTAIESGTVVGSVGSFGSGAITDHAALVIDQASDATLRNDLSGEGSLTKTGAGALTLAGDTHLSGGASVTDGSLQLGSRWNTSGSIAGAQGEDGSPGLFTGSDGKAGGAGVTLSDSATGATNYGTFAGGRGGDGGSALGLGGDGARGGDGLQSSVAGATVRNEGTIAGGHGGNGGDSLASGGAGGRGGDGVAMSASGTLDNSGTIVGGAGGDNGESFGHSAQGGAGGVGITTTGDAYVVNSGSIAGGLGDHGKRADAIQFSGGDNVLELQRGSTITGNVVATAEGNDTLALGGRRDASFDVSAIGDAAQYRNFANFEKIGGGTWTLTGETDASTPWSVFDGTLSISSDANLGDAAGGLTLDGGALRTTAGITSARSVTLGTHNGEIRTDGGTQLSLTGEVSGEGGLIKSGSGELTLGSANSYEGGTLIEAGTLVGSVGSFGSGAIADHAALVIDQASDAALTNALYGTGSLTKTGAGALTLAGATNLAGGARVTDGSLQLGADGNTGGRISGAQGEDGRPGFFAGSDGKAGGTAVALSDGATGVTNYGAFVGGRGGDGGSALGLGGDGARGGDGVNSSVAGATVGNAGLIAGGQGGEGGSAAVRGAGGAGGTGIALTASGTVDNEGAILGGRGGDRGDFGFGQPADAAGGVGITTAGAVTVVNAGYIGGGRSASGATRSDAIDFSGGANRLELLASSVIRGNVVATQAGGDTLALTGAVDGSFDSAKIGSDAQYRNFTGYEKLGSSTWTLTGTTTALTPWSVFGGTLSIAADGSLGDGAGMLTLDGGALRTTADIASQRAVQLGDAGGAVVTDAATTLALAGEVSGTGGLNKQGDGTLILGADNSYSGGTLISAGTLQLGNGGTSGSIVGDVSNNGVLAFNRSDSVDVTGAISGTGAVEQRGTGTTRLSGTNVYSGGTTVSAGTLVGNATSFGSGAIVDNAALVIDQGTDGRFVNVVSGSGELTKAGAGALNFTSDSAAFTGHTQVAAGSLAVNGALGGTLTVADGAILKGNGTVGTTTVLPGGTVAPGNSIGLLNVNGNLTLANGSFYQVEASADGRADLIHATGTITLQGGNAVTLAADGNWNPYKTYTILSADGGVTGSFGGVVSNFAFLAPRVGYDSQTAFLSLMRNDVSFQAIGITPNQKASASAVERMPAGDLYRAVVQLDAPTAVSAFDQLSGELHASARSALMEESHFVRDAGIDRIRQAQGSIGAPTDMKLSEGAEGTAWGRVYGSWGDLRGDGNSATADHSISGILVGADRRVNDWRVGVMGGASHSSVDVDARNSSASIDSYHFGVYGGTMLGSNIGLRTGLNFSRHDLDTHRSVAFTGVANSLQADYHARTTQAFGELGWRLDAGKSVALEPFGNLAYVNLRTDGFAEQGGITALNSRSSTTDTLLTTLGLRASTSFAIGGVQATARGLLGWRHAFGDVSQKASVAFLGGSSFGVSGVPIAEDAAVIDAGIDLAVKKNLTLAVGYAGQFGDGVKDQGVKASLLWNF